jgi:hypothetical protein
MQIVLLVVVGAPALLVKTQQVPTPVMVEQEPIMQEWMPHITVVVVVVDKQVQHRLASVLMAAVVVN